MPDISTRSAAHMMTSETKLVGDDGIEPPTAPV
ncbi:MAG: hypothetical protein FD144_1033 [Rhodospirillaceae bacterium]|nr:MAG: hypothetical protein FD144_1033 [Rhodospirillaceae bacterium]